MLKRRIQGWAGHAGCTNAKTMSASVSRVGEWMIEDRMRMKNSTIIETIKLTEKMVR